MLCWDDLRYFLAVARTGSTLAAARQLRVSQTTAARRVAALEAAVGLILFERRQAGYALTPAGEALVRQAEAVEAAAGAFGEAAASQGRDASGIVRLTTAEIYAVTILPPMLRDLHEAQPGIRIELDTSDSKRDLASGEADVALRSGSGEGWAGLVGRRVAPDPWTMYCSRAYAAAHVRPRSMADFAQHPIIGGGGAYVWPVYRAWLRKIGLEQAVAMEHGTSTGLLAAVRAGFGMAVLPTFFADRDPELVRCMEPPEGDKMTLWLLTHERLRQTPRVRAVMDFLGERLARMARLPRSDPAPAWASVPSMTATVR
jgi:DNA-binding transcriptional LysR family regulator